LLEGNFEPALHRRTLKLFPGMPLAQLAYAFGLVYDGQIGEANHCIDVLERDAAQSVWTQLGQFLRHSLKGDKRQAVESVTDRLRAATKWNEYYPLMMADCFAMIDEKDEAIDWIEEAVKWGCINYPFLNEYDPCLGNVRGEERFKELMVQVKQAWENFEV
jgi:hypothetical protein